MMAAGMKKTLRSPDIMSSLLMSRIGVMGVNKTVFRVRSTSTLSQPPQTQNFASTQSQRLSNKKDFSTRVASDYEVINQAVLSATLARQPRVMAQEMDLAQAVASKDKFDKILLLVNHGEAAVKKNHPLGISLTGKGVGQALTLSGQTAVFCNDQTGLSPELVVLAPLGCSIQTALYAFPYSSPAVSIRGVDWICHGHLVVANEEPTSLDVLKQNFPGMNFTDAQSASTFTGSQQVDHFMTWLQGRHERVIVGKLHCCWFCFKPISHVN
jgi:hypothetical protein